MLNGGWGGGEVGDFEKNSCKRLSEEKNVFTTNEIENISYTAASKKKKCSKAISSFQGGGRGALQNPSKTANILPLLPLNSGLGDASECAMLC